MSQLKIGDKVKICSNPQEDTDFIEWSYLMDETCGLVGEIIDYDSEDESFYVKSEVDSWWYEKSWLEKIEEVDTDKSKQPTTWNNIEVGDIIKHDAMLAAYSVVRLGDDRAFITDDGDYILHKDIVAIYKKSWKKPKALEDMSKEELIEMVRKLQGGNNV